MVETAAYKEWLSSAPTDRAEIETIEVAHPKWGSFYMANWDRGFSATLEDGSTVVAFQEGRFYMQPSETSDRVAQATEIQVSSLEGKLYRYFKDMTAEERQSPITVTHRIYMHTDFSAPVISPPPSWTLHAIQATFDTLSGELRSVPLRVRRIGIYYTKTEFPVLVFA